MSGYCRPLVHALHGTGHLGDFRQLVARAFFEGAAGVSQLLTQLAEAVGVAGDAVDQAGDLGQKVIETGGICGLADWSTPS